MDKATALFYKLAKLESGSKSNSASPNPLKSINTNALGTINNIPTSAADSLSAYDRKLDSLNVEKEKAIQTGNEQADKGTNIVTPDGKTISQRLGLISHNVSPVQKVINNTRKAMAEKANQYKGN